MPARGKTKDRSVLKGKSMGPFRHAVRSPVTLDAYERRLAQFFREIKMNVDDFVTKAKRKPAWGQKIVLDYLLIQKERTSKGEISAATLPNIRKPIRLLLEMNDVVGINWDKISRFMPKARKFAVDRAPTMEEIRALLSNSDVRLQAILLTMVSSGIRIGSWDELDWGHIEPRYMEKELVAAKVRVYPGDVEEYFTFMTPEAYRKLEEYMETRKRSGEKITRTTPIMRDKWDAIPRGGFQPDIKRPNRLSAYGVKRLIENTLWRIGIRTEKRKRHEFSIHSFRKFFKTRAEQVMRPINVETLMGHSIGISDSYYRPIEKELLEDYIKAVPLLTISEVEEVRRESQLSRQELEERLARLEDLVSREVSAKGQQAPSPGQNHNNDTSRNKPPGKVVKASEIERFITEGWEPLMALGDGRIVIKQP